MTTSRKSLVPIALGVVPVTIVTGLAVGFFAGDVLPALRTPLGERYLDTGLALGGVAAYATLAVLFSRMPGPRSWLPPVMLLFALVDLRRISEPHPIGVALIATTWLLTLVLRPAR